MLQQAIRVALLLLGLNAALPAAEADEAKPGPKPGQWRALHLLSYNTDKDLEALAIHVPKLAERGLNVLILEVNYHFQF